VQKASQRYQDFLNTPRSWTVEFTKIAYQWDGSSAGANTKADVEITSPGSNPVTAFGVQGGGGLRDNYEVGFNRSIIITGKKPRESFSVSVNVQSVNFKFVAQESLGSASATLSPISLANSGGQWIVLSTYRTSYTNKVFCRLVDSVESQPIPHQVRNLPLLDFP
jgi:hypothetical protein